MLPRSPTLLLVALLLTLLSLTHATADFEKSYSDKDEQLSQWRRDDTDKPLTTEFGTRVNDTDNSLKAGVRGPTLLEDFHFREKITHFDHERIPERAVHARGSAAFGYFESYGDYSDITRASFLSAKGKKTSTFVRFSTVLGSRGSADTVRDVRGFATRFFTDQGNFDIVGNNIPVFFVQDAIKFLDLIHAGKPEQDNEIPQAATAHDNFYDFVNLAPETLHTLLWALSPRGIPRSYRKIPGFGVHTFRLIDWKGNSRFVKFHWRPLQGESSLVWDEAQKIAGKNPDFHRQDLWDAIEAGHYPEYELGLQIVEDKDEFKFDFDLLDATKIIPEELVPVKWVGKMTLNRNPDNFFSETEQSAYHLGHVVPGIDFTNDPLLQGRLFSYVDTQINRFSSKNYLNLPINRPIVPVHNNHRDGFMQYHIFKGPSAHYPHSRPGSASTVNENAFVSRNEKVDGHIIRARSPSFKDFYSQPQLFWNSLSWWEQSQLIDAASFELGKIKSLAIREGMVNHYNRINHTLATEVARRIGVAEPTEVYPNKGAKSSQISLERNPEPNIVFKQIAVLVAEGVKADQTKSIMSFLKDQKAVVAVVGPYIGKLKGTDIVVTQTFSTGDPVLYDAIVVPGGDSVDYLYKDFAVDEDPLEWVRATFRHVKPILALGQAVKLVQTAVHPAHINTGTGGIVSDAGVVVGGNDVSMSDILGEYVKVVKKGRFFERFAKDKKGEYKKLVHTGTRFIPWK
ncbi:hypothetical protein HK104_001374 [Borealophlyctis nickersoniae]|nr:hypothetical protein HK104_001374 [Borealophlyctis nickersoniae]